MPRSKASEKAAAKPAPAPAISAAASIPSAAPTVSTEGKADAPPQVQVQRPASNPAIQAAAGPLKADAPLEGVELPPPNKEGLIPGQPVDFETIMRNRSAFNRGVEQADSYKPKLDKPAKEDA